MRVGAEPVFIDADGDEVTLYVADGSTVDLALARGATPFDSVAVGASLKLRQSAWATAQGDPAEVRTLYGAAEAADLGQSYVAGQYYLPAGYYSAASHAAFDVNEAYYLPFYVARRQRWAGIVLRVNTGVPSAVCRMGINADANGMPGAELTAPLGTVDCSTAGNKEIEVDLTTDPGIVWLAVVPQGAAADLQYLDGASTYVVPWSAPSGGYRSTWRQLGVSGALPADGPTSPATFQDPPAVWLRAGA